MSYEEFFVCLSYGISVLIRIGGKFKKIFYSKITSKNGQYTWYLRLSLSWSYVKHCKPPITNCICKVLLVQRFFIWSWSSKKHGCLWKFLFLTGWNVQNLLFWKYTSPKLVGTYMWGPPQKFLILYHGSGEECGRHRQILWVIVTNLTILYSENKLFSS